MQKTTLTTLVLLIIGLLLSFSSYAQSPREYINARSAANESDLPFSGAVLVGDTLYLSGAIGLDENRKIPSDPAAEARNVLNAIKGNLEQANMTMEDLVSLQIFCSDVKHYQAFNQVYRTFFSGEFPARAFIGSGALLFDARFEVQGIAIKR